MPSHSSVLAWRIPGMREPGGLPSMGSHRVGHDLAAAAACNFLRNKIMELRRRHVHIQEKSCTPLLSLPYFPTSLPSQ